MKIAIFSQITIFFLILALLGAPLLANAQVTSQAQYSSNPETLVNYVLCTMGLGCGNYTTTSTNPTSSNYNYYTGNVGQTYYTGNTSTNTGTRVNSTYNAVPNQTGVTSSGTSSSGGLFGGLFGARPTSQQAILYGATISRNFSRNEITLVRVPRADSVPGELKPNEIVYEIIGGKKHMIPTLDIFFDYGFRPQQVQFISQVQLDKYPRVKVVRVDGDKKNIYYLTEFGTIRKVLPEKQKEILSSYGDKMEDVITISKKEFNYYPENRYFHLEHPLTLDAYLIVGDTKRYVTPLAINRLQVMVGHVAPVNQYEFDSYKVGEPIIY